MKNILVVLILCAAVFGQAAVHSNLETHAWTLCVLPACAPGGTGIPTAYSATYDGLDYPDNALRISETGPSYSNFLTYQDVGGTFAPNFYSDFQAYVTPPSGGAISALEYDMFAYNAPTRYMMGTQCKIGGQWQVWDDLHATWNDTPVACTFALGAWHHVQWWTHRLNGSMFYDTLGVDGTYYSINMTEPAGALNPTWSNQSGINFQVDIGKVTGTPTVTEFIKNVNLVQE